MKIIKIRLLNLIPMVKYISMMEMKYLFKISTKYSHNSYLYANSFELIEIVKFFFRKYRS